MAFYLTAHSSTPLFVVIEEDYLADHGADVIGPLRDWRLAAKLRTVGGTRRVVVREASPLGEEALTYWREAPGARLWQPRPGCGPPAPTWREGR
jgi:hypothetical protein